MESEKEEIEINPFKVIWKVKTKMLNKSFFIVWGILVVLVIGLYITAHYSSYVAVKLIHLEDFLIPGITGLSFTLALITATTRIFPKEQLVDIYSFTDDGKMEKGHLFYRTIAPYIWTSTIWLLISIGALFSKMFSIKIPVFMHSLLEIFFISIVLMGVMSLWSLLITHIKDISLETEREINKTDYDNKE